MVLETLIDVALCSLLTVGVVALCVLGHVALVGKDAAR